MKANKSIFISYAREDRKWVDELHKFLAPWIKKSRVRLWDDHKIDAGDLWKDEISKALNEANVAVLFVTKDFLNSTFIMDYELPIILESARSKKLRIYWIAVSHSSYKSTTLKNYQSVNDPNQPIDTLSISDQDKFFTEFSETIMNSTILSTLATGLEIIDETTEPFEASVENRPENKTKELGIKSKFEPKTDEISFEGSLQIISITDIEQLHIDDKEYIADFDDSLKKNYDRWSKLRKQIGTAAGTLDDEINAQVFRIETLICKDLDEIFDFLRKIHKYELEDHYGRYRHICDRVKSKN